MVPAIFLLLNVFFISLQSRFISGGDSAEYAALARTGANAHPPGYPLYSLFAHAINGFIPFGTTPWKVALLSSIPTVLTAFLIFKILTLVKVNRSIALLSSILYLFLFPVWQYALIPEVFGLHTFLVMLITYLLLHYLRSNNEKCVLISAFLCGLSVSHHHIFVLFIPGWFFLLKGKLRAIASNRLLILKALLGTLLGMSFYLYAVYTSFNPSIINWENTKTLQGLFQLISRSAYGSFKAYSGSGGNLINQLSDILSGLVFILLDFKILGILFVGLGIYASFKLKKEFSQFLFVSLAIHFAFLFYTNFILTSSVSVGMYERFLIPLYGLLVMYLGIGADYVYRKKYLYVVAFLHNAGMKKVAKGAFFLFLALYIGIISLQNFRTIAYIAHSNVVALFGKNIIDTVPRGGILITQADTPTFSSYYYLFGLRERPDIIPFLLGLAGKEHYIEMIKKRYPTVILHGPLTTSEAIEQFLIDNQKLGIYSDYEIGSAASRSYGLLWKYYSDELHAASESAALLDTNKYLWEHIYAIPLLSKEEKNIFHLDSTNVYYVNAYVNYAKLLVSLGKSREAEPILKKVSELYRKDDVKSEATYMNVLVINNKCKEASQVAQKINLSKTVKDNPPFVKSALAYLQLCDPQNSQIPQFKKVLIDIEKKTKTDLGSF